MDEASWLYFEERLERFGRLLAQHGLAGAILSRPENVYYLSAFGGAQLPAFLVCGGSAPCLIVPEGADTSDFRGNVVCYEGNGPAYSPANQANAERVLDDYLRQSQLHGKALVAEIGHLPHSTARNALHDVQANDAGPMLDAMRFTKDSYEIEQLSRNQQSNDAAFRAAEAALAVGVSELALFEAVYESMVREAGAPFDWRGCLGAGARSALPNPQPTGYQLAAGDVVLIDVFSRLGHYYSDSTRNFCVGKPSPEQLSMHAALEGALHAGERLLHPGAAAGSVDRAVRGSIEAAGYPVYSHHTGHGLGLSQIEPPFIAPSGDTDMRLQPGCVIALEPGVYQPGVGGMRLENVYLVTDGEPKLLTGTPAQLLSSR